MVDPTKFPLSAAQRKDLEEQGVCLTDVLFPAEEIEAVRLDCQRVYRQRLEQEPGHVAQQVRPFLPKVHTESEVVSEFLRHPVFQTLCRELVGPDVDQAWNQACLKLPDPEELTLFPYHQDSAFAEITDVGPGISCFIALGPLTVENGTLGFAKRAYELRLEHKWSDKHRWWECDVEPFEIVDAVLEPGAMAMYHRQTPHGSPPNRSKGPREALLVGFGPPGVRLVETGELFGDQRPLLRGGKLVA